MISNSQYLLGNFCKSFLSLNANGDLEILEILVNENSLNNFDEFYNCFLNSLPSGIAEFFKCSFFVSGSKFISNFVKNIIEPKISFKYVLKIISSFSSELHIYENEKELFLFV